MSVLGTKLRLTKWASWGRGVSLSYPSQQPMFSLSIKGGMTVSSDAPADVWEVEKAVCLLSIEDRNIIVHRYQWRLTYRGMAERWRTSTRQISKKLELAEGEVDRLLNSDELYAKKETISA